MDHYNFYKKLISNRKQNPVPEGIYFERHHIVPRCMGGSDDTDNLVNLTAREHFLAHYSLWKSASPEHKGQLAHAFNMMKASSKNQEKYRYFNSRLYAAARQDMSKRMSILQGGTKNSHYGTKWIFTFDPLDIENTKVERRIPKEDSIPEGWYPGRKLNKVKKCRSKDCNGLLIPGIHKRGKKYCSEECKPPSSHIYRHRDQFIEVFKQTNSMNQACKAIGIPYGAEGGHSKTARRLVEEEGLLEYLIYAKK